MMTERKCLNCKILFFGTKNQKYCTPLCRRQSKIKQYASLENENSERKSKNQIRLSINEIVKIGRKHGMNYGEAVFAIEKGLIRT